MAQATEITAQFTRPRSRHLTGSVRARTEELCSRREHLKTGERAVPRQPARVCVTLFWPRSIRFRIHHRNWRGGVNEIEGNLLAAAIGRIVEHKMLAADFHDRQ